MATKPTAPAGHAGPSRLRDLILGALLFAATVAVYRPALNGEFLLDDDLHVTGPELRSLHGLARIWSEVGATQQYYPVLHTSFWVEHRLWGDAVSGYHLLNVLLHAGAACLVVAITRQLRLPGAWLAGFIFALHPICVESVAWIAEQKNTLSTVFCLGAALAYLRFDHERRTSPYVLASGLFVLALLSKTATATLPAALLVILWWQRSRLGWKRDVLPLLPWLAAGAFAGSITIVVERRLTSAFDAAFALTWIDRGLLAGRAFWFYLLKLVWPANLSFFYERWLVNSAVWWHYLFPLTIVAVAAGLFLVARRTRGTPARAAMAALAALLVFAGMLFPVLGGFNVEWFVFSFVADHLQYLASLGVIVPLSAGLTWAVGQMPAAPRRLAPALAGALLVALGALTWRHSARFVDSATLYAHATALNPASALAHNHYGVALARISGRGPEAIAQFEAALRINPDAAEVHENLGAALLRIPGRATEAIPHLETALRLKPGLTTVHAKLGLALSKVPDRLPDAIAHLREALRHEPGNPVMHDSLGNALAQTPGGLPDAMAEYETALRLKPDFAGARFDLGKALAMTPGREPDAIAEYEQALRLDLRLVEAHYNLGNALLKVPARLSEAVFHYETALRLRPDFAEAHTNLGTALAGIPGRLPEAIAHFEAALRINPAFAPALNNLKSARQLLGELPGAKH